MKSSCPGQFYFFYLFALNFLLICGLTALHLRLEYHTLQQQMVDELKFIANFIETQSKPVLGNPDEQQAISRILKNLPAWRHILYAGVHSKDGRLIAGYVNKTANQFEPSVMLQDGSWRVTEQYIELSHPIITTTASVIEVEGRIYLRAGLSGLSERFWRDTRNHLLAMLGALILLAVWLSRQAQRWRDVAPSQSSPAPCQPEHTKEIPLAVFEEIHPPKVLLVEDNPVNLQVAKLMLNNAGCAVDTAKDGQEAVNASQQNSYSLILMDCQMPRLDGYQATAQIRAWQIEHQQLHTPIIALTANTGHDDRQRCRAAGMDDFLPKPFTKPQLHAMLKQWANWHPADPPPKNPAPAPSATVTELMAKEEPVLEESALRQIRNLQRSNSPDLVQKVIGHYQEESIKLLQKIRRGVQDNEVACVYQAVHSLKSSSANLGANRLADLCKELEAQARAGKIVDGDKQVALLHAEHQKVSEALRTMR